ncbi:MULTISPECIES: hypothetical protein [Streptomyces]|uniref:hypothetical protein n=1 Tax=Streptomyces TaxID=1883 RepID=UPI0006AFD682|nr:MULTISPECIES: hypothetical protein [Streptomyces]
MRRTVRVLPAAALAGAALLGIGPTAFAEPVAGAGRAAVDARTDVAADPAAEPPAEAGADPAVPDPLADVEADPAVPDPLAEVEADPAPEADPAVPDPLADVEADPAVPDPPAEADPLAPEPPAEAGAAAEPPAAVPDAGDAAAVPGTAPVPGTATVPGGTAPVPGTGTVPGAAPVPGTATVPGAAAAAKPAAVVSPALDRPGDPVTVSVSCDPVGGLLPEALEAKSKAFDGDRVTLLLVPGAQDTKAGPVYRGNARIASPPRFEGVPNALSKTSAWTVDGTCPAAPGKKGKPFSAKFTVSQAGGSHGRQCTGRECERPATVEHGVRAGQGGSYGVSVPALVTGGVLVVGALGAAVYRLWRRDPPSDA